MLIDRSMALVQPPHLRVKRLAAWAALTALLATGALAAPSVTFQARRDIAPPAGVAVKDFGGLSGIDYDAARRRWLLISDDPAQHGASRYYTAKIDVRTGKVRIRKTVALHNDAGGLFAVRGGEGEPSDGEAIRVDPVTGRILWSSEGDIARGWGPALRWTDRDGANLGRLYPPAAMIAGVRGNTAYEGLSFTPGGDVWLGLEAAAVQDGPLPTPQAGGLTRLTLLSRDGAIRRQVAYAIDAIPNANPGKNADRGVSEILRLDETRLLVLERSGVQIEDANYAFHVRLYLADTAAATDIAGLPSLVAAKVIPAAKTLLFDFDTLERVGNVEGMAWARDGADPQGRLLLVTDNNFDPHWISELLVLRFRP